MRRRLTQKEWDMLLDAAILFELEPANFESDLNEARLKAIQSAIRKIQGDQQS